MALDKQRILSELGSVINQLQGADCGCMGKLFNNSGACPRGNPLPTCGGCRRGYCPGHGYDVNNASMQGAGDPYGMKGGMGSGMGGMHGGGMGGMHGGGMGGMHGGGMGGMHGGGMGGMSGGGMGGMPGGGMGGMSRGGMGGMSGGGMGGMSGGGMGGMSGGGMGGMSGGGMGGMQEGGMADGRMADGGMNMGGGMPAGGMSGGNMAGGGMNMGGGMRGGGMSAMGRNIPALYADTYNYLNQNLMQPCVKEVYNDLNTITPQNTIAANPLATQMGLPPPGSGGAMPAGNMGNPVQNAGGVPSGNPMGNLSGMGANIVNMMMKGGGGRPANMGANPGGQLRDPMLIDAPNSPHGQVGVTPLTSPTGAGNMGMDANAAPGQPNAGMGMSNMAPGGMQVPTTQYVTQDNMYTPANVTNVQGNAMAGNTAPQGNMVPSAQGSMYPGAQGNMNPGNQSNMNPGAQQLTNHQRYGHHTQGITKFHEMFPGTMQEGLNFDPMAIAIQMNPANQKKAAMDTITKLMSGESAVKMGQPKQQTAPATDPNAAPGQVGNQQYIQGQQQIAAPGAIQPNQQQIYTAQTGAPVMNQQIPQQQLQGQQYQQIPPQQQLQGQQYQQIPPQQQIQGQQYQQLQPGQQQIDPNTGAVITPGYEGGAVDPNAQMQQPPPNANATSEQPMQEIYPADNSRNVLYSSQNPNYHYNTLGQPVEYLPKEIYRSPEPGLPQTLYGDYRQDLAGGYVVKNTMSKTALAGTRPIGRTASKSQLQHIYRQYRASHTNVQQSIKPPMYTGSASVGRLNTAPPQPMAQQPMAPMPVEKVGGDTIANNPVGQPMAKMGAPVMGETGDVIPSSLPNAPAGDALFEKSYGAIMQKRGRNGLQDHSYRPYRQSAGWSFHG